MQLGNVLVNLSSTDAILRISVFLSVTLMATTAFAQSDSSVTPLLRSPSDSEFVNSWTKSLQAVDSDNGPDHGRSGLGETPTTNADVPQRGLISRSVRRGLQDQKQLYRAPFRRSNLKWDALFLTGTAAFLATDRQ